MARSDRTTRRWWQGVAAGAVGAIGIGALLPMSTASAAPAINTSSATYTERGAATAIGSGVTVSGGSSYDGGSVSFSIGSATSTEALSLSTTSSATTTSGAVSIVGRKVYLGNGSGADVIGQVSSTADGAAGQALTVNFTSPFGNASFETGDLTGWTALNQVINLGATSIDGYVPTDTSTYPSNTGSRQDDYAPSTAGSFSSTVQTSIHSDGSYGLQLVSSGMRVAQGCDVVHGPAVHSDTFHADAGDTISFDWRAYAGEDNYHVFGYIVDTSGNNQTELLDSTGGGTTAWATKQTTIPAAGDYRFVFVSGTHDASCGRAAGASLVIDNVRVYGNKVDDAVVEKLAQRLRYANTSNNPAASRAVSISATSPGGGSGAGTVNVAISRVNDAPGLAAVAGVTYQNTAATEAFQNATGQLVGTDPENDVLTYGITGSTAETITVGSTSYTRVKRGNYGALRLNSTSGAWVFVPGGTAIDARSTDDSESFPLTVSDGSLSASRPLTVTVDVADSTPGAPTSVMATPGKKSVQLSWTAPSWTGGTAISSYVVESSTDGVTWTREGVTTSSSYEVTGLRAGTATQFRVSAVNATGTGAASSTTTATPYSTPGAPEVAGVTAGSRRLTVTFAAPTNDGGNAVTGYEYSTDGGTTWHSAQVSPTETSFVIDGLGNGTAYQVRLRAVNQGGSGSASPAVAATPTAVPVTSDGMQVTELEPGESQLLLDGVPQPVTITTEEGTLTMSGDGFSVGLGASTADGTALAVDDEGRLIATDGGTVRVSGDGFRAGSTVDVWIFSTPRHLGDVVVGADGRFSSDLPLPEGIELGAHTVQLNGVSHEGELRSLSTGIVVQADGSDAPRLAYTGMELGPLVAAGVLLVLIGAGALLLARRRRVVS